MDPHHHHLGSGIAPPPCHQKIAVSATGGGTGAMIDSEKFHEWKVWVSQNKLTTIGSVWLGLMATNLAYQFTRPVPLQLKLIHSRVYSQFGTFLSHPRQSEGTRAAAPPPAVPYASSPRRLPLTPPTRFSLPVCAVTVAAVGCIGLAEALDPSMKRKKEQDF